MQGQGWTDRKKKWMEFSSWAETNGETRNGERKKKKPGRPFGGDRRAVGAKEKVTVKEQKRIKVETE